MPKGKGNPQLEEEKVFPSALTLSVEALESARGFHPVPAGTYEIQIPETRLRLSRAGGPMLVVSCAPIVEDDPMAGRFYDYLLLPVESMDAQQQESRHNDLKEFAQSANISFPDLVESVQLAFDHFRSDDPPEFVVLEDLSNIEAMALVGLDPESTYEDQGVTKVSPEQNTIKKWIVGE